MYKTIVILIMLLSACYKHKQEQEIEVKVMQQPEFTLSQSEFVILTYEPKWHWTFLNAKPATLSHSELIIIETILKRVVKENNKNQNEVALEHNKNNQITTTGYELKLKGYKRQYVAVINNKREKEVFINFFCDASNQKDWKKELVQVEDAGNCYYNVKINLVTNQYQLQINYDVDNGELIDAAAVDMVSINEIKK